MALGVQSTGSSASSAVGNLSTINEKVAEIVRQTQLNRSGQVQSFEKNTNDVVIDNNMTARDIGILRHNNSRLNLFSALSKKDSVDVFRFRVTTTGAAKLGVLIADPEDKGLLRVQIFSKSSGRVLADSDPAETDANYRYRALEAGVLELKAGDYYVRLSRQGKSDPRAQNEIQYALQFTQGIYKNDFDTIEKAAAANRDAYGFPASLGAGMDQLISGLSSASSYISKLPPIGTPASSKLSGALYDALF